MIKKHKIKIDQDAIADIQSITDWYNKAQKGLGKRFQNTTVTQINALNRTPYSYAIRYREIRCMLVKNFPYMVHFFINEENDTIEVLAVIGTDRNPRIWEEKTSRQ